MNGRTIVWGTFDCGKPRVRIMLEALRSLEPDLVICHRSPWNEIEDKSMLGPGARLIVFLRLLAAYPALLLAYLRTPQHNRVVVPYPGILDVLVLYPFARLRGAHGRCELEAALFTDGKGKSTFRLRCAEGPLELTLQLQPSTSRIADVSGAKPREFGAVCAE